MFLKDDMVLRVDAIGLMLSGGAKSASRSDVVCEVATDVMGLLGRELRQVDAAARPCTT